MRLSQIRLAGFKTFVDPTTIHIPGSIVGIVGPNGCGKSNVIDALRWVLGESKASSLRGKSMQDVIFSGSATRKPISRASVELVFDNSLGRAAGQWSQYSEIAVKRILQRDAESSYYINNVKVRRRDVADIFLGTGLGGNAYAIIEQGMISRIIEADPAELKVFLEEAAGISKYRERRRETENHLSATRENLSRVDDLRQEIVERIGHLEAQASVAKTYRELEAELKKTRNLLWLGKKIQAAESRRKLFEQAQKLQTEIESETAKLRHHETKLISLREEQEVRGAALQQAQGFLYESNAEVSSIQKEIDHLKANRARLASRMETAKSDLGKLEKQHQEAVQLRETCLKQLGEARSRLGENALALEAARAAFSGSGETSRMARNTFEEARLQASKIEQEARIEEAHLSHAKRMAAEIARRRENLESSLKSIPKADEASLARLEGLLEANRENSENSKRETEELARRLDEARSARREAAEKLRAAERLSQEIGARLKALIEVQKGMENASGLGEWLKKNRLEEAPRLWRGISVEPGWEVALEAVLGERINAIFSIDAWKGLVAPGEAVFARNENFVKAAPNPGLKSMLSLVSVSDENFSAALCEWLAHAHVAKDIADAIELSRKLEAGEFLVTQQGHVVTKNGIHHYGPDSRLSGVLARNQEIEALKQENREAAIGLEAARVVARSCDSAFYKTEAALREAGAAHAKLDRERHELQLQRQKVFDANERARQESARIAGDLTEISLQQEKEAARMAEIEEKLSGFAVLLENAGRSLADARRGMESVERESEALSGKLKEAERISQESLLAEKSLSIRIEELEGRLEFLTLNRRQGREAMESLELELSGLDSKSLEEALQAALAGKQKREENLQEARKESESIISEMREIDRARQEAELAIGPLKDRLNETRMKEQEARISEEQFDEQLKEACAPVEELMKENIPKTASLQAEITRLQGRMESLGAVNLAAFDELQSAKERIGYIESQHADLSTAVETLENAIRKIDRETRERLMQTYEEVNRNLSELFIQLFGGGRASLVLTGEQIIDAGLEIEAQPPGKKNASIRLLSGGEKALVALSLVFSLFRLNPAPFCLLDEVDAPLDDSNTERFCAMVKKMSENTQFLFISHNRITMEIAHQLIGVTMQEQGVSRIVAVDIEKANGIMTV